LYKSENSTSIICKKGQLGANKQYGFWQHMDTLREKQHLSKLAANVAPLWFLKT
jgi:hypothetical protein